MKYKLVGKSGLRASEFCLGTMTFGEEGWGASKEESRKIFDFYAEAGGNFLDTANSYANGKGEEFIGEFIKGQREKFVIATKYSLNTQSSEVNLSGNHRKNMIQSVEHSLKRLNTDYIDLLWLHIWDYTTPIEEVMRSFDDLIRAGKILYIGISDTPAWIVSAANTLAQFRGWSSFIGLQIEYSLKQRTPERELIPMAASFDMAVIPWSPLGGGLLSGKYSLPQKEKEGRLALWNELPNEREQNIANVVMEIAKEVGKSPSQIALNWIIQQYRHMFPIVGARTVNHLKDNLEYGSFSLNQDQLKRLDDVSKISMGFPSEFFNSNVIQNMAFSGTLKKIERNG